jgi:hypothetical protein
MVVGLQQQRLNIPIWHACMHALELVIILITCGSWNKECSESGLFWCSQQHLVTQPNDIYSQRLSRVLAPHAW